MWNSAGISPSVGTVSRSRSSSSDGSSGARRSSVSVMRSPLFRKAICWKRARSVSKSKSMRLEDGGIGVERLRRAGLGGLLALDQAALRLAAVGEGHPPDVALPADLGVDPAGERVDHRDADAVQAARDRVAAAAELAAGVQDGHHDLDRRLVLRRVHVDRDAAAVVHDFDAAIGLQHDFDVCRSSRPVPHRPSCPRPRRRGGAGRGGRWNRCTCPDACGPPPSLRGP